MAEKEEVQDSLFSHVTLWEELRACKRCSSMHPLSHYRQATNNVKRGYYFMSRCRSCIKIEREEIYERKIAANLLADKRECTACKEEKHRSEFNIDKSGKGGLYSLCKSCQTKSHYFSDFSSSSPTQEDFERYLQATCCECCGEPFQTQGIRKKCQDHDHDTNALRGIICRQCNFGEGLLKHGLKKGLSDHSRSCVLKYMEKWGITPKDPA